MSRPFLAALVSLLVVASSSLSPGGDAAPEPLVANSTLARMPVKEITFFKDGHAFVLHEGTLPADEKGDILLDYLPAPVLGTFWPYSSDPAIKLKGVTAGTRAVSVERTALDMRSLLEANLGARVVVKEGGLTYHATIVGIPERGSPELAATSPPNTPPQPGQKGSMILLATDEGTKAVPIDRIQDVTFRDEPKTSGRSEEFRNLMTLQVAWPEGKRKDTARIGMAYLQRGIRWIPSYKVTIDGKGHAHVELSATLLNEMTDLNDVTAHLVIGAPTFAFKGTLDPISLQQAMAELSPYFQEGTQSASMLSNAIMTQTARMSEYRQVQPAAEGPGTLGPQVGDGSANEDLFVFTIEHVSLRRGERMVLPVVEYDLEYRDIYTLDFPIAPPAEVVQQFHFEQKNEIARLLAAPKVIHQIRLANRSLYPLTTAPALIVENDRVLAQGMMTYTARGASTDLAVTAAVGIQVRKTEVEAGRVPNAEQWQNEQFMRIDLAGTICLVNFGDKPVEIEVTRHVLGELDLADHDGAIAKVNTLEEGFGGGGGGNPYWWHWYSWPYWWHHFNAIGRATWKVKLDAGKNVDLGYKWHYYWR